MPELPEVETIRRGLEALVGRTVTEVVARRADQLRPTPEALLDGLPGRAFRPPRRYGKHLLLDLDGGWTLAIHLRMTGQLRLHRADDPRQPHTHLELRLDDGHELRWRDVRRFGWLHLTPTDQVESLPSMAGLGPDALEIGRDEFGRRLAAARRRLKALLLAQDVICGLGNIYADEVLWHARLHPLLTADRLGPARRERLYEVIRGVLTDAVAARGSSIDGEYVAVDGYAGEYQLRHAVYGREGLPCPRCGAAVKRILVGARSTHYCPSCQRRR